MRITKTDGNISFKGAPRIGMTSLNHIPTGIELQNKKPCQPIKPGYKIPTGEGVLVFKNSNKPLDFYA